MIVSNSKAIQIGWAARDVTPDRPVNLRGQFHMRISTGIDNPVTVTALALSTSSAPDESVIFVSCDRCSVPAEIIDRCREVVRARVPALEVSRITFHATHTHTAPEIVDGFYPPVPAGVMTADEYAEVFVAGAAEAIQEAWANQKPGGVSWALGTAVVGHNRRISYTTPHESRKGMTGLIIDGTTRMYGKTNDPTFSHVEGYEDHYVDLLFTWDPDGRMTGMIINLACPSQETEGAYTLSADFWHEIRSEIRKRHGTHLFVLPQCSAAGDQSPHRLWYVVAEDRMLALRGLTMRQEIGRRVANAVGDVLLAAQRDIQTAVPLKHAVRILELPWVHISKETADAVRVDLGKLEKEPPQAGGDVTQHIRIWRCRKVLERYELAQRQPTDRMELHVVRLGDIAFATNRFELYLDYGIRIKARSPAIQTFVIQLAGGGGGYLPTARSVAGQGYGSTIYDNVIGPEGGQIIVEETVKTLKELFPEVSVKPK